MSFDVGTYSSFEQMAKGEWHLPIDNATLNAVRRRSQNLMRDFNEERHPERARTIAEEWLGAVGGGSTVVAPAFIEYGRNTFIGPEVFINAKVTILDSAPVTIEKGALIGPDVRLITVNHPVYDVEMRRHGWEKADPITIEEEAWIGAGVTVLPGVRIGARSVIGAGAIVTTDIPADSLALGVPARVVDTLENSQEKWERDELPDGVPVRAMDYRHTITKR
ncbi:MULTISPECIES: sugar O-acetyltransferase [unclassified Corynebacterium]|uniref:sugar O-acetyltransferase n=1 Tax=unclassified Corynebacterium TaxID=2624378 RepID=UPI001C444E5E|nr:MULTISPECIES: sugar O-acetyltransferase [unclassified Corynebacterium]MBV7282279.1 sugar O-acetyltransferase [Corynebacterium sp. TAE3-ERU30]MBV7302374.1 sugar O-acetyltransferase [Corynebacterium sp. TAE3-ERU2]